MASARQHDSGDRRNPRASDAAGTHASDNTASTGSAPPSTVFYGEMGSTGYGRRAPGSGEVESSVYERRIAYDSASRDRMEYDKRSFGHRDARGRDGRFRNGQFSSCYEQNRRYGRSDHSDRREWRPYTEGGWYDAPSSYDGRSRYDLPDASEVWSEPRPTISTPVEPDAKVATCIPAPPLFNFLASHEFGVASAMAAARSGGIVALNIRMTRGEAILLPQLPSGLASDGSGNVSLSSMVWLPVKAQAIKISVGFPSVGLGNKLFLYFVNRIACILLHKPFEVFPMHHSVEPLACEFDYNSHAAGYRLGTSPSTELCVKPCHDVDVPMSLFTADQADIGRILVQYQPSFLACGPLIQRWANMVGAWAVGFVERCCKDSIARGPPLFSTDLVVHVRTGDVWLEPGESHAVNPSYCPAPVWWYRWLVQQHKPSRVVVIASKATSTLVAGVIAGVKAAGCEDVLVHSSTEHADLGILMRANHLAVTVSSFSWWAALLSQFVQTEHAPRPASAIVNVHVPLTGMMHPRSRHRTHCDLTLNDAALPGVHRLLKVHESTLEQCDDWRSSKAQQALILAAEIPAWFTV